MVAEVKFLRKKIDCTIPGDCWPEFHRRLDIKK